MKKHYSKWSDPNVEQACFQFTGMNTSIAHHKAEHFSELLTSMGIDNWCPWTSVFVIKSECTEKELNLIRTLFITLN